jgi:hypothetical protein
MRSGPAYKPKIKLPVKRSRGERVLQLLYAAPCSLTSICSRHADFGISPSAIVSIYEGLMAIGCAELVDGIYSITPQAKRHFDRMSAPVEPQGPIAGPAYVPPSLPLKRPTLRLADMREGATDYLNIPSRVGDLRLPHGQGK